MFGQRLARRGPGTPHSVQGRRSNTNNIPQRILAVRPNSDIPEREGHRHPRPLLCTPGRGLPRSPPAQRMAAPGMPQGGRAPQPRSRPQSPGGQEGVGEGQPDRAPASVTEGPPPKDSLSPQALGRAAPPKVFLSEPQAAAGLLAGRAGVRAACHTGPPQTPAASALPGRRGRGGGGGRLA